ncbi:MAG: TatD family hydrolase [Planctomycetia bacterium]|nr:TatD family hydrolase [Planctomycetia bacterium]
MFDAHTHVFPSCTEQEMLEGVVFCTSEESEWEGLCARMMEMKAHMNEKRRFYLFPQFGVHPWFVEKASGQWITHLEMVLAHACQENWKGAGVGEIGLDHFRLKNEKDWETQLFFFRTQMEMAWKWNVPVSIHCVRCWDVLLSECRRMAKKRNLPEKIILHAYSAPQEMTRAFYDLGCYFSLSPAILDLKRKRLLQVVKTVPQERLFVETDRTPKQNMKTDEILMQVLQKVAITQNISEERLQKAIYENMTKIFL